MAASEKTLKEVERKLKAKKKSDAYIYGTKRKMGWKPKKER